MSRPARLPRARTSTPGCSGTPISKLAAAQRAALAAGMETGIITDLAVGRIPAARTRAADQDLLVGGLSVGAPPDEFNQRGQDWSQPPWHPRRLAEAGRPAAGRPVGAACGTLAGCGSIT